MSRVLWMTKGPLAGKFEEFDDVQAKAIIDAGMGQDIQGLSDRNLSPAVVTKDEYPVKKPRRRTRKAPAKSELTYKRRDMQAEEIKKDEDE